MREIKFVGKRKDNGKWICGLLDIQHFGECEYAGILGHAIDPYTLGQYTEKKDRDGAEIYEWYIVKYCKADGKTYIGVVKWNKATAGFEIYRNNISDDYLLNSEIRVIVLGNIFDNPKLLKGVNKND
jgi:uncharacterized phage protein (TIGR01671 family)